MTLAHIPSDPVDVPERVRELAGGAAIEPVWRNQLGGLTFRATGDGTDRYIKWGPRHLESSFAAEADRLRWAAPWTPVPHVVEHGVDDTHEWLVTVALDGESAVSERWRADPETAVRAVGRGLRALHEALPVEDCPFSWGTSDRVASAAARGIDLPAALRVAPPIERAVVCHGDACCPNTLVTDDGEWAAHVDLGALGVADRWADIAVAAMSTEWNYGPGWADALIEAYGVEPDRERLAFYRALWTAT